jgi:hypothetical protein
VDSPVSSGTSSGSSSLGASSLEAALERDLAELDVEIGGLRASLEHTARGSAAHALALSPP